MAEEVLAKGTLELDVVVNQNSVTKGANDIARNLQDKIGGAVGALEQRLNNGLGRALQGVTQTIKTFGAVGAAAVGGVLAQSIAAGLSFNALQQRVRAALTSLLQDGGKAEALLKDINTLVDESPFAREIFLQAAQQLVGFGVQAAKIVPILDAIQQAVAGISAGGDAIADFADIFARIQSQGRITGREIERFSARGVDAANILQRAFGKTKDELASLGSADVIDALIKGLQEQFGGATEALAQTLDKAQDRFKATKRFLGAELTKQLIDPRAGGAAVEILNNFADILIAITKIAPPLSQLIGDIGRAFVVASQAVEDFIKGISIEQVQEFVDQMKKFAPFVIAAAGALGGLVTKFAAGIPVIGEFLPVLNPIVAAIVGFGLAIPEVRAQVLAIGQAILTAVVPAFNALKVVLPELQKLFANIAESVGPALVNVFKSLAPILVVAVNAIGALASILNTLLDAFQKLGPVANLVLTLLIAKFAIAGVTGSEAFKNLASSFSKFGTALSSGLKNITVATATTGAMAKNFGVLRTAGDVASVGIKSLGSALAGLITPANAALLALTLFSVIQGRIASGAAKAKEIASGISKNIDPSNAQELNVALERRNNIIAEQDKKIKAVNSRILSFTASSRLDIKASEDAKDAANKEFDALIRIREIRQDILDTVSAKTGKTIDEVLAKAAEAGIDLSNVPFDKGIPTINQLVKLFGDLKSSTDLASLSVRELNNLLATSTTALQENLETTLKDINPVLTAQKALNQAQQGVTAASKAVTDARTAEAKIGERLTELDVERQRVLRDTITPLREITNAERALEATRRHVRDIDDQIIETQTTLNRLRGIESAEDLASADRDILRAKIALNEARRAENELLEKANEEQTASISLAGLTVDQIKATLANARATLAAQKARQAEVKTEKTAQQLEDERLTKRLNVLDAEQHLKDSEQARIELAVSTAAEIEANEQKLTDLALEKQVAVESQADAQTALNTLRAGETTLAAALKTIDDQIKDAKIQQKAAAQATLTAVAATKVAAEGVRDAEIQVGIETAKVTKNIEDQVKFTIAFLTEQLKIPGLSDTIQGKIREQIALRQLELDKIREINSTIATTNTNIAAVNAQAVADRQNVQLNRENRENQLLGFDTTAFVDIAIAVAELAKAVIDNNLAEANAINSRLQQLARATNTPIATLGAGAVVNSETFARIGESGREVVLPLTRPARLEELLSNSQVLPPVLAALGRISLSKSPGVRSMLELAPALGPKPLNGLGNNVVVRRGDGPMTYGQAEEIITLLKENGKAEIRVEAPITVAAQNETLLVRKISDRIERSLMDKLNRR